jgi:hypothetical protein
MAVLRIRFIFFPFGGHQFKLSHFYGQLDGGKERTVMNNVTCLETGDILAPVRG